VKKVIGILGGISPESTRVYYERLIKSYYERYRNYYYPRIIIYSLDFQAFTDLENNGDTAGYIGEIMEGIEGLQRAGADFVLMAANSPHAVFEQLQPLAQVLLLSIVEVTAVAAQQQGWRRLLLLGIKFTMQASFYQTVGQRYGLEIIVPNPTEQEEIDRIIFAELSICLFRPESKARLLDIIQAYPVDGVILGCTELPLILQQADTAIPLLDTLDLHVQAALDYALAEPEP
jgi:aspartate racemase